DVGSLGRLLGRVCQGVRHDLIVSSVPGEKVTQLLQAGVHGGLSFGYSVCAGAEDTAGWEWSWICASPKCSCSASSWGRWAWLMAEWLCSCVWNEVRWSHSPISSSGPSRWLPY